MFEDDSARTGPRGTMPSVRDLDTMLARLGGVEVARDDHERIELITALERLKSAAAGDRGRGVASQVALARRDSPVRGGRHVGLAKALVHEMPRTLRALAAPPPTP